MGDMYKERLNQESTEGFWIVAKWKQCAKQGQIILKMHVLEYKSYLTSVSAAAPKAGIVTEDSAL